MNLETLLDKTTITAGGALGVFGFAVRRIDCAPLFACPRSRARTIMSVGEDDDSSKEKKSGLADEGFGAIARRCGLRRRQL